MGTRLLKAVLDFLASYLFACILLIILFALTLFGTLEQVDHGLYEVQKRYFESIFFLVRVGDRLALPMPGAALVMGLLAVNLLLGGLLRIRKGWSTAGVIVVHVGIAMLLAAGLVKQVFSQEGNLRLFEGERSDEYVSYYLWEVAIFRADERRDVREHIIPHGAFTDLEGDRWAEFTSAELPFVVKLSHFTKNCRPLPKGPMWDTPHPVVDGWALRDQALEAEAEFNVAGVYVTVSEPGGEEQRGILWGAERYPWVYESKDGRWAFTLRHTRYKMPFEIVLDDFTRELHPRTGIAKSFMSDVTKVEDGEERRIRIEMNEPLRHEGLVLFQASWGPGDAGPDDPLFSVFAVVRNPSDYWPVWSCIVIGVGLAFVFIRKLVLFLGSQKRLRAAASTSP